MGDRRWMVSAGLVTGILVAGGCSNSGESSSWLSGKPGAAVRAADFAGEEDQTNAAAVEAAPAQKVKMPATPVGEPKAVRAIPPPVVTLGAGAPTPGAAQAGDLKTNIGAPELVSTAKATAGASTVEAVVGQINGRPVFASEILEPLDGTLRAAAEKAKDLNSWQIAAAESIVPELKRRIADELILSEARRSLTPEQKQGLLHFLGQIEGALISNSRGSEVQADEQLREQTGRSLSEAAQDEVDKALIRNEINSKVLPRVAVPWRDVQNEYERQHEKWHPPAEYTFRMVYATASNAASVEKITTALAGGTGFDAVAADEANEFNRREKGLLVRKTGKAQTEGEFSPWPEVNEALRKIGVGQTAGPIEFAPDKNRPEAKRVAWVHLDKIDQKPGVSLYEAQLEVESDLRTERERTEQQRYFEKLWKRGNVSKLETMVEKIMNVATERYAPRLKPKS